MANDPSRDARRRLPDTWIRHRSIDEALEQFVIDVCGEHAPMQRDFRRILDAWNDEHPDCDYSQRIVGWINVAYEFQASTTPTEASAPAVESVRMAPRFA